MVLTSGFVQLVIVNAHVLSYDRLSGSQLIIQPFLAMTWTELTHLES